jgi:PDZ domain-containing protein
MHGADNTSMHPRLSRETRRLLTAATVALVALWVLARVRFPDRPVTPNPISPLLTQLAARPAFNDLAAEIGQLRTLIAPSLAMLPETDTANASARPRVGVRLSGESAVTYLQPAERRGDPIGLDLVALDRVTGLAVVRVMSGRQDQAPVPWSPVRTDAPKYLAATEPWRDGVSLSPLFVSRFPPTTASGWSGPIWQLPSAVDFPSGTFLFTPDGELAGLIIREAGAAGIVPGEMILADAERLVAQRNVVPGELGVSMRSLTPALAAATGAEAGVVVAWVNARSSAAAHLAVGDVIEGFNDSPVKTLRDWEVRSGRLTVGDVVELSVRRMGEIRRVKLTAAAPPVSEQRALGLTLRWVPGVGSEVVRVESSSAAAVAGVARGDFITLIGSSKTPTPATVREVFDEAREGQPIVLGLSRGDAHDVVALTKR